MILSTMRRRRLLLMILSGGASVGAVPSEMPAQCVSLTTPNSAYYQDFNTLVSSGTSSATPAGWTLFEGGALADGMYAAGDGSSSVGNTYSFGSSGSSERAFGTLHGGSLVPKIGACFTNNTGSGITRLEIAYTGEQWRRGTTNNQDQLAFQYSMSATDLNSGTWTGVGALSFQAPITGPGPGPLDGNAPANRTALASAITDLAIPDGETFWIRWPDDNANDDDDGLAVDDFRITAGSATSVPIPSLLSMMTVFPNPSSSSFSIRYRLQGTGHAELAVFDVSGRLVRLLESGMMERGERALEWDGTDETGHRLASGVYFVRLEGRGRVEEAKIAVVR